MTEKNETFPIVGAAVDPNGYDHDYVIRLTVRTPLPSENQRIDDSGFGTICSTLCRKIN